MLKFYIKKEFNIIENDNVIKKQLLMLQVISIKKLKKNQIENLTLFSLRILVGTTEEIQKN